MDANGKGSVRNSFAVMAVASAVLAMAGCQSNGQSRWSQETRLISLDTQPQGARVWQITAPLGGRVDLGTTPLHDQGVAVLTKYQGSLGDAASAQNTTSLLNQVRLHIEKPGYQPYDLTMSAANPDQVEHRNVLLVPATQPAPTAAASASR